ncbi:MAG: sulfurtransferase [Henriciella sp.]
MSDRDPLVSADWLRANFARPDIMVVDATWVPPFLKDRPNGKACYAAEHIPGAPYFDIDLIADPNTALSHMLPSASAFADHIGALGIDNRSHVIAYDSNGFFASARVWWMFRAMGHESIHVLDGGLQAWKQAGGVVTTKLPQPEQKSFAATLKPELITDMSAMHRHVQSGDTQILDARAQGRFDGTSPEPRPDLPSGHMPGSICVPVASLLDADGTLKSKQQLSPLLAPYLDRPSVTTCGSGVSAAVISLALARLGDWSAGLYDGSWSEWASDADNPIATLP